MPRRAWNYDELVLAMNLYCQLPFGKFHARNPQVVRLAEALGRTPSSVAMKLCNLASLDPAHQERGVSGLSNVSLGNRRVWNEFHGDWNTLVEKSEHLRLQLLCSEDSIERILTSDLATKTAATPEQLSPFVGDTENIRFTRVRLAQRFFRRAVLASYNARCCVSGISAKELLVASHILPWSSHPNHRADPRNGLCLSRLHDAAFDRGLISFDSNYRLVLSRELQVHLTNRVLKESFLVFDGQPLKLPQKFRPLPDFLATHRDQVFRG